MSDSFLSDLLSIEQVLFLSCFLGQELQLRGKKKEEEELDVRVTWHKRKRNHNKFKTTQTKVRNAY